jgi:hypothetical protein
LFQSVQEEEEEKQKEELGRRSADRRRLSGVGRTHRQEQEQSQSRFAELVGKSGLCFGRFVGSADARSRYARFNKILLKTNI